MSPRRSRATRSAPAAGRSSRSRSPRTPATPSWRTCAPSSPGSPSRAWRWRLAARSDPSRAARAKRPDPTRDLVSGRNGSERVAFGGSCAGRAAAGEAGAANVEALGSPRARAVTIRRLLVTWWRSGKSAAPAFAGRGTPLALCTGRHSRCPSPTRDGVSGRLKRQRGAEQDQPPEELADQHEEDGDVEEAGGGHGLRDLQRAVDHEAEAESGEGTQEEARGEQGGVVVPQLADRHGAGRRDRHHEDGDREHAEVHDDDGHEVAKETPHRVEREAQVDQIPVAEEHAGRDGAEGQRAGHEGERVEHGRGREERAHPVAARARGERDQAEEEREREGARPAAAALAPEGCEVARLGDGERGPESDLAVPDRDAAANGEVERRAQVEDGAADEHPGARLVEAALEEGERRHGEGGEAAHGELAEDEEEAGAEVRHPSLLIERTGRDKHARARARPEPAAPARAAITRR